MARKPKQTIFPEETPKGFNSEGAALCKEYGVDESTVYAQERIERPVSKCLLETGMVLRYKHKGLKHIFVRMKPDIEYPYKGETFFACVADKLQKWELSESLYVKYGMSYHEISIILGKSVSTIRNYIRNLYAARWVERMMLQEKHKNDGIVDKQHYTTLINDLTGLNEKDDDESENKKTE